ncbi:thioredoxin family protein [Bacillus alkalicellulosilyticus]|uniref:thioredoxin family protein n=1 Tax=Alkalihalobacterium alkalicellulosilyticum TaxID=1912214 RepID=UPI0009968974|nr:thioredoxin family protein [Bacillus alkalicellulosilyticus]
MKKVIIFSLIIIVLFTALALLTNATKEKRIEGNPYNKSELHPETVKQLDNPNYQNIILPDELDSSISSGENVAVYFYSPTCPACQQMTPVIVPLTEENGIDLKMFNLLEFEDAWRQYQITATPTLVYYNEGQEVARVEGLRDANDSELIQWLDLASSN